MRMSELSRQSATPVPSIKLYLREGLLPAGERRDPNQADYSQEHVRRLRVIRGLVRVGGLSIAAAKGVLDAIDSEMPLNDAFGIAQRAASVPVSRAEVDPVDLDSADELMHGWHCSPDGPGRLGVAQALRAFTAAGQQLDLAWLDTYVDAARRVAKADLDIVDSREGLTAKAETVVIGTVLGDALFAALRRAAQEHLSGERYRERASSSNTTQIVTDSGKELS